MIYSVLKVPDISFEPNSITVTSPTLFIQQIYSESKFNYSYPLPFQSISDYLLVLPLQTIIVYYVFAIMKCLITLILIISKSLNDFIVTSLCKSFKRTLTWQADK